MRILVCGGNGFLGRHIVSALINAGHDPVVRSRHSDPALNFVHTTSAVAWLPHLEGMDAVINAVGALRDLPGQPLQTLHATAPMALFDACALAGVRRVVQVSALGVNSGNTAYARTKRAADEHLQALNTQGALDGLVVRPSIIFGAGGASTALFLNLARLPALLLPPAVQDSAIQPVAVRDLAAVLACLATDTKDIGKVSDSPSSILEIGGPQPLALGDLIASLRAQMGSRPAAVGRLPQWMAVAGARIGDRIPSLPWCSDTLAMLQTPNVCDPSTLAHLLGHAPVAPGALYATLPHKGHA